MKVIDFFRRFSAAGGDVTKISYRFSGRNVSPGDKGVRSVMSFDGEKLFAYNTRNQSRFDAAYKFLHEKDYSMKVEVVFKGGGRRSLLSSGSSSTLLTLTPKD